MENKISKNEEEAILIQKYLKEIEEEVDNKLIELGAMVVENGKKIPLRGSCHVRWPIEKRILKERYDIDWKTPSENHPNIIFD